MFKCDHLIIVTPLRNLNLTYLYVYFLFIDTKIYLINKTTYN